MVTIQTYKMERKNIHLVGFHRSMKNVSMTSLKKILIVKLALLIFWRLLFFK